MRPIFSPAMFPPDLRPDARILWLLATLVVLNVVWPIGMAPSYMIAPFLMGTLTVACIGWALRPALQVSHGAWLLAIVLAISLGPAPDVLATLGLAAAVVCVWILFGVGQCCASDAAVLRCFVWAFVVGMLINVVAAWIQYIDVDGALYPLVSINESSRPYGNLRQPNHLATYAVLGLMGIWWLFRSANLSLPWASLLALVAASGVALSGSRTGFIELSIVALMLLMWRRTARRGEFVVFVLAPLWAMAWVELLQLMAPFLSVTIDGIRGREMDSVPIRFMYWKEAWTLALMNPVAGVGWGNLAGARLTELTHIQGLPNTDNVHNTVMQLLAETGFATTALVVLPVALALWRLPPWRAATDGARWAWLVIALLGVHSMLEYPLWYMNFLIPAAVAFGVHAASRDDDVANSESAAIGGGWTRGLAASLAVASAMAFADYVRIASVFKEDGRASPDLREVAAIQNTVLFRHYADRAVVERVALTQENASLMVEITQRLLNQGANPIVMWVRLEAFCRTGHALQARELAAQYEVIYPSAYAEFMTINSENQLRQCGLLPARAGIVQ
jgi:O-antigen ligase